MIQLDADEKLQPPQGPPPYTVQPGVGEHPTEPVAYPPAPQPVLQPGQPLSPGYSPVTPVSQPIQPRSPSNGYPNSGVAPMSQAERDMQLGNQYQQQLFARCARGDHSVTTKYGTCGIITAVLLFPIGLICLFADVERRCDRCGEHIV